MTRHRWILSALLLGLWTLPISPAQATDAAESEPETQQTEEYPCLCRCPCGCTYPDYGPQPLTVAEVEFPLPETVHCMLHFPTPGQGSINFQTELSLVEAIAFYRTSFTEMGLIERTINTAITESVFSVVFDGWSGTDPGEVVVVQGVDLGGRVNINIRIENLGH
ncbi:MAG: hypothetical protein O2890_03160 [Cyanobacteria bacterium]|nr:hypothetical protein [Cyanobacteriota bacterium]MDA0865414.1 hypothetical protein [Cyanobacteriota bacterium]